MAVSGVTDWLIQRISSIVISSYTIWMVFWILSTEELDYYAWTTLFSNFWMQIYTVVTVLAICSHAWVGLWTIGTDYLTDRQFGGSASWVRASYNIVCFLSLLLYGMWVLFIMWNLT